MADIFSLVGKITVDYAEAKDALEKVSDSAEDAADDIEKAGESTDNFGDRTQASGNRAVGVFKRIGTAIMNAFSKKKDINDTETSLKDLTSTINKQESELSKLKAKYADLYVTQGKNSKEAKETAKEIDKLSSELKENKSVLQEAERAADKYDNSLDEVGDSSESASSRMSSAFKKIGSVVAAAFAVDKIVDFGKSIVDASATVAAEESAFEQIMGGYSSTAKEKMGEVADAVGMTDTRLTPYMTSMTAKFKGLGYDIDDATTLAADGLTLAADASAFWDKSLEDSMGALNSFINGSYEGGEAIGLFANDTQLASYAVKEGIVSEAKEWANLDEARKQATRLQYAQDMMAASGATGQAAKEAGQYANVQAELTEKWRQFKAQIGEPLLQNVVIPAMGKLSGVVDKASVAFEKGKKWILDHKTELEIAKGVVIGVTGAVSSFLLVMKWEGIMSAAKKALTGVKTAMLAVNAAMSANPIGLVIAVITGLVAAFVYLWNTSDSFRNFWIGVWESIKTVASGVWESIKDVAMTFWEWIRTTSDSVINGFKDGWNSFKDTVSGIWTSITDFCSTAWETIKNVVQVGIMFVVEIITFAIELVLTPWRFIWENCKSFLIPIWESIKSVVSTAINAVKNVITNVMNAIKTFLTNVWNGIKTVITTVLNVIKSVVSTIWNGIKSVITTVLNAIKSVVTTIWNNIKSVTSSIFNAVKSVVSSVWESIKSVITNVVNGVKSTVSNVWNSIKSTTSSVFNGIKDTASNVWNSIKSAIEKPINAAKDAVKSAIDKMKSFFNFRWSLPKLKLPHISISGKFSLSPPSVPKFGIQWYKKAMDNAMLLDRPSIFGYDNVSGKFLGGGEAGTEVVSGANTLMGMIRDAVSAENANISYRFEQIIKLLEAYMPEIIRNMAKNIYLDTGVLVGELGTEIDYKLGDISKMRERGM